MPAISIIVPIYNVELYLHKCIDSILAQTINDFEIILVNDGSPDKCRDICEYYAENDNRIQVIHKPNEGVSSARNKGIDIARGEYIAFVDPDDTIEPNMYELLLKSAVEHKADIVVCPIKSINLYSNITKISSIWENVNCVINKKTIETEIIPSILLDKTYSLVSSVNKLYRKSVFDSLNIRFDENKHHSEDARLNFTLLTMINNLVYIEQPLYNYFIRKRDSLTQVFRENLYEYATDNKNFLIELCRKYNQEKYIDHVRDYYTSVSLSHIQDLIKRNTPQNHTFKILLSILNDKEFVEDILKYKSKSLYFKIFITLCIRKNAKLLYYLVKFKIMLQSYIVRSGDI